jgi:DNA-binding MarR family transcriptional regulator
METIDKYDLNESIAFLISRAHSAMNRRLLKNFKDANHPITSEQYTVLLHLWEQDKVCQRALCCSTGKDKPGITRIVDNLEKLGYVERVDDENDRRMKLVKLTQSGKELEQKSNDLAKKTLIEFLEEVDCASVESTKNVLRTITQKFDDLE